MFLLTDRYALCVQGSAVLIKVYIMDRRNALWDALYDHYFLGQSFNGFPVDSLSRGYTVVKALNK